MRRPPFAPPALSFAPLVEVDELRDEGRKLQGTKWKLTDRSSSVQSLAKVFEVVAGIQVGSRRNSRGRIPLCLTRKYFSGMEPRFRSLLRGIRISGRRSYPNRFSLHPWPVPVIESAAVSRTPIAAAIAFSNY